MEQNEAAYRGGIQELAEWCYSIFLAFNVSKTKQAVVDFRAAPTDAESITIKGQSVDMASAYRYLGMLQESTKENVPPAEIATFQNSYP